VANILIADDDGHIREVVRYALEKAGYGVVEAADGVEALDVIRNGPVDLAVLDIIMPGEDGIQVCRQVASKGDVPVIFLTSRDEEVDRILGLELGADDYVTKPFSPRELVARVGAVLRRASRAKEGDDAILALGSLELDVERHRCRWDGSEVELTVTEFAVLRTLLAMPGKVYTRVELVDRAYGHDHHVTERTIDSHIRRIRKKLGDAGADDPIETVHGLGYRMRV
jgi:two-component system OmpR family response regulator